MDKSLYFYRNIIFSKNGKTISLVDMDNPENSKEPLDPWLGMVLQLADGQHSIDQLTQFISTRYNGMPPHNLEQTIESAIDRLVGMNFVLLSDKKVDLPYYLSMPYEMQDPNKSKLEIEKDRKLKIDEV